MANSRNGNTWFVDTAHAAAADDLVLKNVQVQAIIASSTGASGRIVLQDVTTGETKFDIRIDPQNGNTNGGTQAFYFWDNPVTFSNGVKVSTLTTATATLIFKEQQK